MKELITLRLFSPLTANLYTPDEYGGLSDWPEELTPAALRSLWRQRRSSLLRSGSRSRLALHLNS